MYKEKFEKMYKEKFEKIYEVAEKLAKETDAIKNTLACNCDTVSYGMLSMARSELSQDVQLTIGWISIKNHPIYKFTKEDVQNWKTSKPKKFPGHAWLTYKNEILDLTLTATLTKLLNSSDQSLEPNVAETRKTLLNLDNQFKNEISNITFMTKKTASALDIIYTPVCSGDKIIDIFLK